MRAGFTGTRYIEDVSAQQDAVQELLDRAAADCGEFTTGACIGFDAFAGLYLYTHYRSRHEKHRVIQPANRSRVAVWWSSYPNVEVIDMPPGTDYRARNSRILDFSDVLYAVADYPELHPRSKRSGTWMTIRIARARDIPVEAIILNP